MSLHSPQPPVRPHDPRDGRDASADEVVHARLGDELTPAAGTVDRLVAGALATAARDAARPRHPVRRARRFALGLTTTAAALLLAVTVRWIRQSPPAVPAAPSVGASSTVAVGDLVVYIDPDGISTIRSRHRETPATADSGLLIALTWIQPSQ